MAAAAEGKSNIGIPKKVGKEFMAADPGGKLPARKGKKEKDKRTLGEKLYGKGGGTGKVPGPNEGRFDNG
jgi:hypothetical protein